MRIFATALLLIASSFGNPLAVRYAHWQQAVRDSMDLAPGPRLRAARDVYEKDLGKFARAATVDGLAVDDLRLLYRAASAMTLMTHDDRYLATSEHAFDELERRKRACAFDSGTQYRLLVALRRFDAARSFAKHHPTQSFEALPTLSRDPNCCDAASPKLLSIKAHGELQMAAATLKSATIVVVGHPLCHFSQNAIRDIEADGALADALKRYWIWVAPQDGLLASDAFEQWNRSHPSAPMSIVYRQSEWPMPGIWETPTFYFVKNGSIAAQIHGWPKEGHLRELRDDATAIGINLR